MVVVVLTIVMLHSPAADPSHPLGVMRSVTGDVRVFRNGENVVLQTGAAIYPGDEVLMGESSEVIFDYEDATVVEVRDRSHFSFVGATNLK